MQAKRKKRLYRNIISELVSGPWVFHNKSPSSKKPRRPRRKLKRTRLKKLKTERFMWTIELLWDTWSIRDNVQDWTKKTAREVDKKMNVSANRSRLRSMFYNLRISPRFSEGLVYLRCSCRLIRWCLILQMLSSSAESLTEFSAWHIFDIASCTECELVSFIEDVLSRLSSPHSFCLVSWTYFL